VVDLDLGGGLIVHVHFANVLVAGDLSASKLNPSTLIGVIIEGSNSNGIFLVDVDGQENGLIADLIDLDFSGSFSGDVTIDFSYNPTMIDSFDSNSDESDVVALHYEGGQWNVCGDSADQSSNTIQCTTDSLSPFTVGVGSSAATGGTHHHGGGGAPTSGGSITFPASYFDLNPLLKILIQSTTFLNAQGQGIFQANVGEQIEISNLFTNYQQVDQNYAFIVEITDQNGVATDLGWQNGDAPSGKTVSLSRSWTPQEAGVYTVKIFVWDDVNDAPAPLSGVTVKTIRVTE